MNGKQLFLVGFLLVTFANQAMWVSFAPVASQIAAELKVEVRWVGFLPVLYPIFFLLLSLPAGRLADAHVVKWVLVGGMLTVAGAWMRFAGTDLLILYGSQALAAVSQPLLLNSFVPLANQMFPQIRSVVLSAMSIAMYGGIAFALLAGASIYNVLGIVGLILPAMSVSLPGLALMALAYRSVNISTYNIPSVAATDLKDVIFQPTILVLGCVLGLGVGTFDNLSTWLEPALSSVGLSSYAGSVMGGAIVAGVLSVGFVAPVVSRKQWHLVYLRCVLLYVFCAMAVISVFPDLIIISFLIVSSSLLMFPAYPIIMEMAAERFARGGLATGAVGMVSRIVTVSLTLLASLFIRETTMFFKFLAISVLAGIVVIFLWNGKKN